MQKKINNINQTLLHQFFFVITIFIFSCSQNSLEQSDDSQKKNTYKLSCFDGKAFKNYTTNEYVRLSYHSMRAKDKSFNANIKTDPDESIGKIDIIPRTLEECY